MDTSTGATLRSALSTITAKDIPASLWELLPDTVSGAQWKGEVIDSAQTLHEWIEESEVYDMERLQDMTHRLADSEVEDYYSNINRRVQELSLWANSDLDEEVKSCNEGTGFLTLTDLNTQYLFFAMRGLYSVLVQWAMDPKSIEEVA